MQGALHGGNACRRHAGDFVERIAEHVHQDDAAALRHRQLHERAQAGRGRLPLGDLVDWIGDHGEVLIAAESLLAPSPPQEVHRRVVDDAKQKALRVGDCLPLKRLDGLHQRILHDVVGVDNGADHARTIAM
jgi:hypothetical protein